MTNVIEVSSIGKRYPLGERVSYGLLKEALTQAATAPVRWIRRRPQDPRAANEIWAVKDVSFDVGEGEIVGIIGRNGAGKSTLLKLLSRVTDPTEGEAILRGSVGSLLEVGTGFHPELTGRENVYLNGAILGMSRADMDRRFDEIVEFAGVEAFLDTPLKRYSSGMQVRLAFAVAAHLEPDILIIDEVLAVGDVEFQKKCMGRMEDVSAQGRTILFVSHSMPAVLRLCPRVILLDRGRIIADGTAREVIRMYLESGLGTAASREWATVDDAPGDDLVRLKSVRVLDHHGETTEEADIRHPIDIAVEYWLRKRVSTVGPGVALTFSNADGVVLFASTDLGDKTWYGTPRGPGVVRSVCRVPGNMLSEGQVLVEVALATQKPTTLHIVEPDAVAFHVVDPSGGDTVRGELGGEWPGVVRPMLDWTIQWEESDARPRPT